MALSDRALACVTGADGMFRNRPGFQDHVLSRGSAPADTRAQGPETVPRFSRPPRAAGRTPKHARPMGTGPLAGRGQGELQKDISALRAAMQAHGAAGGFTNAASPGAISLFLRSAHYPDRQAYLRALADAMRDESRAIIEAGRDRPDRCSAWRRWHGPAVVLMGEADHLWPRDRHALMPKSRMAIIADAAHLPPL